jgi:GNAT superfamily N-acetyltransferase
LDLVQLEFAQGNQWQQAMALYRRSSPVWEREPEIDLAQRINNRDYRCMLLLDDDQVVGFSLMDLCAEQGYLLLSYIVVDEKYRGQGWGRHLVEELRSFFEQHEAYFKWLLLEAETGPTGFYSRLGFYRLNIDYQSPDVDSGQSTPMQLMVIGHGDEPVISRGKLAKIIRHVFVEGYHLAPSDRRLTAQLARLPEPISITKSG